MDFWRSTWKGPKMGKRKKSLQRTRGMRCLSTASWTPSREDFQEEGVPPLSARSYEASTRPVTTASVRRTRIRHGYLTDTRSAPCRMQWPGPDTTQIVDTRWILLNARRMRRRTEKMKEWQRRLWSSDERKKKMKH